jgi:hypothetical protein
MNRRPLVKSAAPVRGKVTAGAGLSARARITGKEARG